MLLEAGDEGEGEAGGDRSFEELAARLGLFHKERSGLWGFSSRFVDARMELKWQLIQRQAEQIREKAGVREGRGEELKILKMAVAKLGKLTSIAV